MATTLEKPEVNLEALDLAHMFHPNTNLSALRKGTPLLSTYPARSAACGMKKRCSFARNCGATSRRRCAAGLSLGVSYCPPEYRVMFRTTFH